MTDTTSLRELPAKWRSEADDCDLNALEADSIGLNDAAKASDRHAQHLRECADELEAALSARDEAGAVERHPSHFESRLAALSPIATPPASGADGPDMQKCTGCDSEWPDYLLKDGKCIKCRKTIPPAASVQTVIGHMRDIADVAERYTVEELRDVLREQARRLAAVAPAGMDSAVALIAAERQRQVSVEGWTPDHDDRHDRDELAAAAACYAAPARVFVAKEGVGRDYEPYTFYRDLWPWAGHWWKPKDRVRDLVRAGALIVAEIERLQRAAPTPPATAGEEDKP